MSVDRLPLAGAANAAAAHASAARVAGSTSTLMALIERRLGVLAPPADMAPAALIAAIRAAMLGKGKRIRPMMALLACEHAGGQAQAALDFGCAIEMIHAASLTLDDLPCMDDAHFRRNEPTVHRAHGEDAAILAGVALMNLAQSTVICDSRLPDAVALSLAREITAAIGLDGLVAGQMLDLRDTGAIRSPDSLAMLNHLKTGALFTAAIRGGARIAGARDGQLALLTDFAAAVGYAFQLCDDLKDVTLDLHQTGKDVFKDARKTTLIDVLGIERARDEVLAALDRAEAALNAPRSPLVLFLRDIFREAGLAR